MSLNKPTLTYFDLKGRAEPIRIAFALGNVEYEDKRIPLDKWKEVKPTIPGHRVPVLQVGEEHFLESLAILEYACRRSGLNPQDDIAAMRSSMLCHLVEDIYPLIRSVRYAPNPEEAKKIVQKVSTEQLPPVMGKIEEFLSKGRTKNHFKFACQDTPVAADLVICSMMNALDKQLFGIRVDLTTWPHMLQIRDAVMDLPQLKGRYNKDSP